MATLSSPACYYRIEGLPKLESKDDWEDWSNCWKIAPEAVGWWEIVSGEEKCPLNDNAKIKEWKKKSEKARGQMLGAVSQQYAKLIYTALDAHTAWVALNRFDKDTPRSRVSLLREALMAYMDDTSSL
jgi:hypothetical protein